MGGMIISQTASLYSKNIEKLIYVAAMMPTEGTAIDDFMYHRNMRIGKIRKAFDDHGLEYSSPVFGAQPIRPLNDPFTETPEFENIPKYFIRTTQDDVLVTALQDEMIAARACTRVKDIQSNHFPQISHQQELVECILEFLEN